MHDPMTVAFDIKAPWWRRRRGPSKIGVVREHPTLVTIWHKDPECDGSDDSCGWFEPPLTDADREWARKTADGEYKFWFGADYAGFKGEVDHLQVMAAVWAEVRLYKTGRHRADALQPAHLCEILSLLSLATDNFNFMLTHAREGEEEFKHLLLRVLAAWNRYHRRWWQHPRWHFWHWRIQVHPVQQFKRWAFSRCAKCGRRFCWGYSPVSHSWNGGGPRWFRSEQGVYHSECSR